MKIKIFENQMVRDLESAVNTWFASPEGLNYLIIDIKYSTHDGNRSVVIWYDER